MILPVDDIDQAAAFYGELFGSAGERVWANRHYFHCGEVVLACVEPPADKRPARPADGPADPRIIYFAVPDLDAVFERARRAGARRVDDEIGEQPWGERSFYADDPFGNPLCFVQEATVYTGGPIAASD
ncbi:MAG TPA: VOC family protein [Pseudonocardiaceae bacterium]|nr:VOC family protein [Pseudonocardiaceae bacterium]